MNRIDDIRYTCSTYDEAYLDALKGAKANADVKAQALAEASGRELGRVMALQEGYQDTSVQHRSVNAAAFKEEAAMDSAAEMAVMPGELSVDASVTVTYELK